MLPERDGTADESGNHRRMDVMSRERVRDPSRRIHELFGGEEKGSGLSESGRVLGTVRDDHRPGR